MERLLNGAKPGEIGELEKGMIHFSPFSSLNDSLDGYIDIAFKGDTVLWGNLFKNYIYSFIAVSWHCNISSTKPPKDVSIDDLSRLLIRNYNYVYDFIEENESLKCICNKILTSKTVDNIINELEKNKDPIYLDELYEYLYEIYKFIIINDVLDGKAKNYKDTSHKQLTADIISREFAEIFARMRASKAKNKISIFLTNFTYYYLINLDKLMYKMPLVASFSKNQLNLSMWGYYADSFKGACLSFKTVQSKGKPALCLSNDPNIEPKPRILHRVIYKNTLHKSPFFNQLGNVPDEILEEHWHKLNNITTTCKLLKKDRLKRFIDITRQKILKTKLRDWAHEEEFRIIEDEPYKPDTNGFNLYYRIGILDEIVFGHKADPESIMNAISIISERAKKSKQQSIDIKICAARYINSENKIKPVLIGKVNRNGFEPVAKNTKYP